MEDDDFGSEFGSVISLQSLDDSSQYQEKSKHLKKSKGKDRQPYFSQSSGSLSTRTGPRRTGHEAWSSAIRNGFTGLSSENSPANRMGSPQVQRKGKSRSSTSVGPFSRDEHILASGKPAYKSPEDYYDDIMELRQVIKGLKTDNGVLKTKLQRITQENVLKDRQIKDLLNPNKQPDEIRRTLTDKNSDSSAIVSSLKQKIHLMERNVKDKESELRKLKSDLKSTNIDELRIQMETYYEETQRLQTVLSSVYSQVPGTRNISDSRLSSSRSSSVMNTPPRRGGVERTDEYDDQLKYENQRLKSENQSLKKDLLCAIDSQRNKDNATKNKNVDIADMNRLQMLRKIGELEQALEDGKAKQKSGPKESKRSGEDPETELRKQRGVIENLKQDRAHYREEAESLRAKLEAAEDEISELKVKLRKTNDENRERLQAKDEYRRERNMEDKASSTISPPRPTPKQRNRTGSMKKRISFHEDTMKDEKQKGKFTHKEDGAARVLQRNWRSYNNKKNSPRDDDDIVQLQSALRAHAIRRQRVELLGNGHYEVEEDLEWDDAVTRVQSAMRAHHARRKYYSYAEKYSSGRSRSEHSDESDIADKRGKKRTFKQQSFLKKSDKRISEPRYANGSVVNQEESDNDSDDDVVIGGSRLNLRNDGKKSSMFSDEASVRGKKSSTRMENSLSRDARRDWKKEINSEDSDDDSVQMPTRFGKSVSTVKEKSPDKNGFSFGNNATRKKVDEQKMRNFFGKESEEKGFQNKNGAKTESSLDNFFISSRASKAPQSFDSQAGSDPESEVNSREKRKDEMVEEKPKKSLFSWGSTKRNNKNVPVPPPRKKTTSDEVSSKSANVWSSRPSATLGDDDDDDDDDNDVIVTPKISRKNPTKTASLLDELF
ncbi:IQ domain-containing protein E-like [Dendronephthya gigantea]|uniref:IQ domain-containing protein E-like n=1 Tax=Dendronephthya gigantea TaxID=151771 RepID=UPI00106C1A36|nr:IQ domain-containing protein E-like [Dendronephthya gigantea]